MKDQIIDILLVEDREEDAELTMLALNDNNLVNEVKWVHDGQEALDYLFAEGEYHSRDSSMKPRIILLDLKMPKVDGIQVLTRIRESELTKRLPVIVLTTSEEDQDVKAAYNLGVNSYIVKPVDFEKFISAVRRVGMYWLLLNRPPED